MAGGRAKVARTFDALVNNKILLNNTIKHITVSYESKKAGVAGTKYFLYEVVPPLKYHNPTVTFSVNRDKDGTAITVQQGAEQLRIEALSKTAEDILSELISKTGSSDERHADYLNPEWARKKAAA